MGSNGSNCGRGSKARKPGVRSVVFGNLVKLEILEIWFRDLSQLFYAFISLDYHGSRDFFALAEARDLSLLAQIPRYCGMQRMLGSRLVASVLVERGRWSIKVHMTGRQREGCEVTDFSLWLWDIPV